MSNPTLSELMGRVLHHLYETTRHANAPVSLDIKQLAIDLGSTEPQVRKALEALKNSGHAEVRIYLNNQAAVCITADGELAVERAMTSTPSKATLKTTHVLAARRLGELRQKLDSFVDVPVQTEVDLEYFKEKSRSWIADVEHALKGIYEDDRVITECLRHLGLGIPSSRLEELRSALVPQGVNKKVYDHARALKYELKNTRKELEYLEGKLALFSAPTRPPTTEEKNAASQDAIERFNNANRRTPSPTPPKSTQSATVHSQSRTDMTPMQDSQQTRRDPKEVFVIYGRNANAVTELTRFLKATGLTVKTFDRHSAELGANPSVDDIVNRAVDSAKAVIVLVTPDEYIVLRPDLRAAHDKPHEYVRWGPRPNVIYEAGLAMAKNRAGTIFVALGNAEMPSDISGIHIVRLSDKHEHRKLLFDKLKTVGCTVDETTDDWRTTEFGGNFASCLPAPLDVNDPFMSPSGTD